MAAFFGTVQGQRGQATRLGHRSIETVAASWHGAIKVELTPMPDTDTPHASVWLVPWRGAGDTRCLYQGALPSIGIAPTTTLVNSMARNLRERRPALANALARCQWHTDVQAMADVLESEGAFTNGRTDFLAACGALDLHD